MTAMSYAEYDRMPGVRWSRLRAMAVSAMHYQAAVATDTAPRRLGRAVHSAILEPGEFRERWVCYSGRRDKRTKEYQAFLAENEDKEILSAKEMNHVIQCAAAVRRHPVAMRHLGGAAEHVVTWLDQLTGLRCKARCDLVAPPFHLELKSSARLDDRAFARTAANLGYHVGLAFHHDGLVANGLELDPEPLIIGVETAPPFDVVVFNLPEASMLAGRREYQRLLVKVADCAHDGLWPGRAPDKVVPLVLPDWAFADPDADPDGLELDGERVF